MAKRVLKIPYFRGVYMIDTIPHKPRLSESAIVNLDSIDNPGTHWVCYFKNGDIVKYFDSYGNLKPPPQIQEYMKGYRILYNRRRFQRWNSEICGQLCLKYLMEVTSRSSS